MPFPFAFPLLLSCLIWRGYDVFLTSQGLRLLFLYAHKGMTMRRIEKIIIFAVFAVLAVSVVGIVEAVIYSSHF
jgi:hypothetical protein